MFDFNAIAELSRIHCVAICTFLVPANLLLTLQTLIVTGINRPIAQIRWAVSLASLCAIVMVLHVLTWFTIGVVQVQTFILLSMGATCLGVNLWAIAYPQTVVRLSQALVSVVRKKIQQPEA
ncbi:MAG: hypothetical protein SWY16_13345 [Cyanobacteriota bacterium]|nr:hypothetical protein [Cyanobacteriota bacterium]